MSVQDVSQAVFDRMKVLLDEASEKGTEGVYEHFKASAYAIGAQMAVMGKPENMPEFIDVVVSELGRGLQAGLRTAHGIYGHFGVEVTAVNKSR